MGRVKNNKTATGRTPAAHICGYGGIGRRAGFRCCHLSEEFPINQAKAGLACFYRRGSSATLRLGRSHRVKNRGKIEYAGMVELVDTQDLGSCAVRRVGSSPTTRTMRSIIKGSEKVC